MVDKGYTSPLVKIIPPPPPLTHTHLIILSLDETLRRVLVWWTRVHVIVNTPLQVQYVVMHSIVNYVSESDH